MNLRLMTACWLCAGYVMAGDSAPSRPTQANRDFFSTAMSILQRGTTFIDFLAEHQVGSVINDVYSRASEMKIAKDDLKRALLKDKLSGGQLREKIESLKGRVMALNQELQRFAKEIHRLSGQETGELVAAANNVTNSKIDELDEVANGWQPGDRAKRAEAVQHLNLAIGYSQSLMDIAKCLKESVDSRKLACDPKKLQERTDR